jgi:hypothetical protein
MSATTADTETRRAGTLVTAARLAETKAGGSDVMNGSNAIGHASAVVRNTAEVTGVIGQVAVDTAAATGVAT